MAIILKRVYEPPSAKDGYRVLVDRLWPRGVSKARAELDEWARDIAPSNELRKWFHADPTRWAEFRRRYLAELKQHRQHLRILAKRARKQRVALVYGARDPERNHALVLKQCLLTLGAKQ